MNTNPETQYTFFGDHEALAALSQAGDRLEELERHVDFVPLVNIPVRAARSATHGRPPRLFPRRFYFGRYGTMIAHNSHDSSSATPLLIKSHPDRPGAEFRSELYARSVLRERMNRAVNVDRQTPLLLPVDLKDWVQADDLVHLVIEAVEQMDLQAAARNAREAGSAQYLAWMMLALLIYCYTQ